MDFSSEEHKALAAAVDALYESFAPPEYRKHRDSRRLKSYSTRMGNYQSAFPAILDELKGYKPDYPQADPDDIFVYTVDSDSLDFKRFLPYYLPLHTDFQFNDYEADLLFRKLGEAKWQAWPGPERVSIANYLDAFWRYYLTAGDDVGNASSFLDRLDYALVDTGPFLDVWLKYCRKPLAAAIRQMAEFIENGWALDIRVEDSTLIHFAQWRQRQEELRSRGYDVPPFFESTRQHTHERLISTETIELFEQIFLKYPDHPCAELAITVEHYLRSGRLV